MKTHFLVAAVLLSFALSLVAGCGPKLTSQATIDQLNHKIAAANAKAGINQVNGQTNPIVHPLDATNNLVVELRPWLIAATIVSSLLWAIEFGLRFTSFTFLSFLEPVFRWVAILSLAALIALPFLPVSFLVVGSACLLLSVYEIFKDRGNVAEAITDSEALLGFKVAGSSVPGTATVKVDSTVSVTAPVDPGATGVDSPAH